MYGHRSSPAALEPAAVLNLRQREQAFMALLLKCGAVFLHVPKTGGTWITQVLEESGLAAYEFGHKHADFEHVINHHRQGSGRDILRSLVRTRAMGVDRARPELKAFKFCFVRHPIKWYESWWKYMTGRGWNNWGDDDTFDWHPCSVLNGLGDPDFNQFMRNVIEKRPGYVTEMYGWYVRPGVHFVGKQETLVDDLITVLRQLNLDFDEQKIRNTKPTNESKPLARPLVWDPDLKREVERIEYAGLKRFGYLDGT